MNLHIWNLKSHGPLQKLPGKCSSYFELLEMRFGVVQNAGAPKVHWALDETQFPWSFRVFSFSREKCRKRLRIVVRRWGGIYTGKDFAERDKFGVVPFLCD
jgi:hypothetical protein